MILSDTKEHIYRSDQEPMEIVETGAYFIRGDNTAVIAKVEMRVKEGDVFGEPLPPM